MERISQEQLDRLIARHGVYLDTGEGSPMDISGKDVSGLSFAGENLFGAVMDGVYAKGADFSRCNMWYAHCEGATFLNCNFTGTKMCYGFFYNCDFSGSNLEHINPYLGFFHKSKFDGTVYEGRDFEKIKGDWEKSVEARHKDNKPAKRLAGIRR